jgi:membrane protein implicated in regulation of membrane protease activity
VLEALLIFSICIGLGLLVAVSSPELSLLFKPLEWASRRIGGEVAVGSEALVGKFGIVVSISSSSNEASAAQAGLVQVGGETWSFRSQAPLEPGANVKVVRAEGVTLEVVAT